MIVLGLSAFLNDSAAVLLKDGEIVAAAQEERFTRGKHQGGFPERAMAYCLETAGIGLDQVDAIAVHGDAGAVARHLGRPVEVVDHALAHAASAFLPSPFAEALVLVLDAEGPSVAALGQGAAIDIVETGPHSLGALYSAVTAHLGFRPNSGEYKVMGLAPYGVARHRDRFQRLIAPRADGWFEIGGLDDLQAVLGLPRRAPDEPLTENHKDVAATLQAVTEEAVLRLAQALAARYPRPDLCLAGAVALNCVANGRLWREGPFADLWVQPAADDAGGALGAALLLHHRGQPRSAGRDRMCGALLGPSFAQADMERRLAMAGARFAVLAEDALVDAVARELAAGKVVGWFQGRMEFGPRALGARSILADPRSPSMQGELNMKVKFREGFRPFAPAVPREQVAAWFDLDRDSPYMLMVAPVKAGRAIPAVTHVDGSARVQTVDAATQPLFHALLERFGALTGCPVLVNTSFNVRGEPIVCTPEDAFRCFMGSGIDVLAVGSCLLLKEQQDPALTLDYRSAFAPD